MSPINRIALALLLVARREAGESLAEYSMVLALVTAVAIAAVTALGLAVAGQLGAIVGAI